MKGIRVLSNLTSYYFILPYNLRLIINSHINQRLKLILSYLIIILLAASEIKAQNFWEPTSGPEGGHVKCLAVSHNNMLFSGFDCYWFGPTHMGRSLYRSQDEGSTWDALYFASNKDVQSIVVDTTGAVYILTGGHGVHKSTDNGNTWTYKTYGIDAGADGMLGVFKNNYVVWGQYGVYISSNGGNTWNGTPLTVRIKSLFIDNEDDLFAGLADGGLYRSSNYGEYWFKSDLGMDYLVVNCIIQYNPSVLYAATGNGIYRSADRGFSWNLMPGSPQGVISICTGAQGQIFAGTDYGLFYSPDEGRNWIPRNNGLINQYITSLLKLPSGSIAAGTYGDGVFITSNNGESWQPINNGVVSTHVTAFFKYNEDLFAGSEHGILYRSSDRGNTWIRNDSIYTFMPVAAFCKSSRNSLFYSAAGGYNFDIKYKGDHWEQEGFSNNQRMKDAEMFEGGIFKSEDAGITWRNTSNIYANTLASYLDTLTGNEYVIAGGHYGVDISTDDGENWYPANNGLETYIEDVGVNSLGYFYASSPDKIFRSTNFGQSWQVIYTGNYDVYHTTIKISNDDYIYAGHDWGKVILSTDYGDTWLERGENLNVNRINSIAVDSFGHVFAGNWWGDVYESVDQGIHWRLISTGLIGGPILNLFCDNEGNIYAGPWGGGAFRGVSSTFAPLQVTLASPLSGLHNIPLTPTLKWFTSYSADNYRCQLSLNNQFDSLSIVMDVILSDTSVITDSLNPATYYYWRVAAENEYGRGIWSNVFWFKTTLITDADDDLELPFSYSLDQNFPNPFNPLTHIRYSIPEYGKVVIKIFDVLGNEIEKVFDEEKPAGTYELTWNAENLPSGIYFYQLRSSSFTDTKKMILMK